MAQNILITFLQALKVKHTVVYASKVFEEHPYRYSLLGLSELLDEYQIPNVGVRVKHKNIFRLNTPFVAHIANDFVVVDKVIENKIGYYWKGRYLNSTIEEFNKLWDGIALIAEPEGHSMEPEFWKNWYKELLSKSFQCILYLLLVVCLVLSGWSNHIGQSLSLMLLLFCSILGLQVSYFLLQKQMKNQSGYADKLCTLFHQKDCNDILETSAAKIGFFSWSEIGFGYFLSNIILITGFPNLLYYMALINVCALPYTVWSIWFQACKVKQWCILCVIVQVLLWVLFILNMIFHNFMMPEISVFPIITFILIYLLPVMVIHLWVNNTVEAKKVVSIHQNLISLKGNNDVFAALLKKEEYYPVEIGNSQIIFGNPQATVRITILTNPHCEPCGRMHERVETLLKKKGNDLCVQYIFSAFNEKLLKSNRFLIAAYLQATTQERELIYSEWYKKEKYNSEAFFQRFRFNIDEEVENELKKHERWRLDNGLSATPTILVNGFRLPKEYKIEDLQYQTDVII